MRTAVLFSLIIFLIGLSFVGNIFDVEGLNSEMPSPEALASGNPTAFVDLVTSLIPSFTGVLWFDMILATITLIIIIGGYRIANPFGG